MSDASHEHEPNHEGPIRTPKQLIVAVLFSFLIPIFGIILLVNFVDAGTKPAAGTDLSNEQAVAARIAPIGMVEVKDPTDVAAMKTGEQVYQAQCLACHGAGVAGAPKFGDQAAWASRVTTGYEALLTSALKGKGAMGAQGGGDFSDLEIGRAVVHMANAAGAKFEEPKLPAAGASAPADATAAAPAAAPAASGAASDATAGAAAGAAAAVAAATQSVAAAPAAGAVPAVYTQACSVCHTAGVAGAPKTGDKAAWAPRVAQGLDTLVKHAIEGKGAMPPRGGSTASDEDIKTVVTYMMEKAK